MAEAESQSQTAAEPQVATVEVSEFESLLNKEFRPKTDSAKTAVQEAVKTLAQQALASTGLISKDALQAIEAIRSQEHLSQTPIIALSARADRRYHELVRQAGANEVLSKPADLTNLVLLIKSYVDQTPAEHLDYQPE